MAVHKKFSFCSLLVSSSHMTKISLQLCLQNKFFLLAWNLSCMQFEWLPILVVLQGLIANNLLSLPQLPSWFCSSQLYLTQPTCLQIRERNLLIMQLLHPLNSCCTIYVLNETRVLKCGYNSVSQLLHVPAVCHKAELAAQLKQLESSQHNSFLSTFYLTFFKAVASKFQEHL